MNQVRYWLMQVYRSWRSRFLIQLAASGAITVGLFLIGLALLSSSNLDRLTQRWNQGLHLYAYLKPTAEHAQIKKLERLLLEQPQVESLSLVSSEEAYQRLQENLGRQQNLLSGMEKNFLPASLEITLRNTQPNQLRPLLGLLGASPIVEEVDYMGAWVERLTSLTTFLRFSGLMISLVISLACLYMIASTIRLGVFSRQNEIQILKLVGATDGYIRAPFIIEGALQGLCGACLAIGLLYLLFSLVAPRFEELMSSAFSPLALCFFSPMQISFGILIGIALGISGCRLALGRYLDV